MCGFQTNNTTYYVDTTNHLFWGGKFTNKVRYLNLSAIIGARGLIYLEDGRVIKTSTVIGYI